MLDRKDIKILWENDHYDIPLEGVCYHKGDMLYFSLNKQEHFKEDGRDKIREIYATYKMTFAQMKLVIKQHDEFKRYVGGGWDHDENGVREPREEVCKHCQKDFYKNRIDYDITKNEVYDYWESIYDIDLGE
jgi:hypothetical protein